MFGNESGLKMDVKIWGFLPLKREAPKLSISGNFTTHKREYLRNEMRMDK